MLRVGLHYDLDQLPLLFADGRQAITARTARLYGVLFWSEARGEEMTAVEQDTKRQSKAVQDGYVANLGLRCVRRHLLSCFPAHGHGVHQRWSLHYRKTLVHEQRSFRFFCGTGKAKSALSQLGHLRMCHKSVRFVVSESKPLTTKSRRLAIVSENTQKAAYRTRGGCNACGALSLLAVRTAAEVSSPMRPREPYMPPHLCDPCEPVFAQLGGTLPSSVHWGAVATPEGASQHAQQGELSAQRR